MSEIEAKVIDIILQNAGRDDGVTAETNFVRQQILDSFAILSMIMQLEQVFKIKFSVAELADDAMQTPAGLAKVIADKMNRA